MSTRSVIYNLQLNSNIIKVLQETEAHAKKLDGAMWQLQKSLAAFGVGLGAHFMKDFALDMVEGATEMERAMLRIKNVSENSLQGMKNQFFIRGEVDKFKIDLQDATDAYGDFLTMVRGSGLAGAEVRKLHDEVLTIGKVTGISKGQMDASVRNLGKLLEEGALEGRHLRPLTYQMSGLMPYISKELGMTNQELEGLISSGKLTKANIDSKVLLDAIEKYANDLLPKLDESLQTIESHTNDAKNAWLEFKNELVLDNKGELNEFIDTLRDGAKWLTDHKDEIVEVGGAVANIAEFYIKWRLALLALQTPSMVLGFINTEMTRMDAILGTTTLDTEKQVVAQDAFNLALSTSVKDFNSSVIAGTAAFEAYKAMSESEFALANNIAYVNKELMQQQAVLAETSTQLTLFTESQIYGKPFTPTQQIEDEYTHKLKRLQELQIASDEFFEKEKIYGIERESMEKRLDSAILKTNEIYAQRLLINQQIAEYEAKTVMQGELFTAVELDLLTAKRAELEAEMAKINLMDEEFALMQVMNAKAIADAEKLGFAWFEAGGAIEKTALEMSQLVTESKMMADAFVVGAERAEVAWQAYFNTMNVGMEKLMAQTLQNTSIQYGAGALSGIAPALSGAGKSFVSGAMNVFMVGMAADLLMELFGGYNENKAFKDKSGFQDLLFLIPDLMTPGVETSFERISKMNDLTDDIQSKINKLTENQSLESFNPASPMYGQKPYLDPKSKELYKIFADAQKNTFLPLMESVFGLNNKSEYAEDIVGKLTAAGFKVPSLYNPYTDPEFFANSTKDTSGSHKIDKIKNERIRGNSSHYITINIDEMNGMNNPTFTVSSSYDMKNIEKQVGDSLVKILTWVVNDSQLIGK